MKKDMQYTDERFRGARVGADTSGSHWSWVKSQNASAMSAY